MEAGIEKVLKKDMDYLEKVTITGLSQGSVIAAYDIIVNETANVTKTDIASAINSSVKATSENTTTMGFSFDPSFSAPTEGQ